MKRFPSSMPYSERLRLRSVESPIIGWTDSAGVYTACREWTGFTCEGYGKAKWDGRHLYMHRLSFELAFGPIPADHDICHHCDNRKCIRPEHLFAGTRQDNMDDMVRKGRALLGEEASNNVLTREQVSAILIDPRTQREIARAFCVDQSTVSNIRNGKSWGWWTGIVSPGQSYILPPSVW